jgi:hypothetical protein
MYVQLRDLGFNESMISRLRTGNRVDDVVVSRVGGGEKSHLDFIDDGIGYWVYRYDRGKNEGKRRNVYWGCSFDIEEKDDAIVLRSCVDKSDGNATYLFYGMAETKIGRVGYKIIKNKIDGGFSEYKTIKSGNDELASIVFNNNFKVGDELSSVKISDGGRVEKLYKSKDMFSVREMMVDIVRKKRDEHLGLNDLFSSVLVTSNLDKYENLRFPDWEADKFKVINGRNANGSSALGSSCFSRRMGGGSWADAKRDIIRDFELDTDGRYEYGLVLLTMVNHASILFVDLKDKDIQFYSVDTSGIHTNKMAINGTRGKMNVFGFSQPNISARYVKPLLPEKALQSGGGCVLWAISFAKFIPKCRNGIETVFEGFDTGEIPLRVARDVSKIVDIPKNHSVAVSFSAPKNRKQYTRMVQYRSMPGDQFPREEYVYLFKNSDGSGRIEDTEVVSMSTLFNKLLDKQKDVTFSLLYRDGLKNKKQSEAAEGIIRRSLNVNDPLLEESQTRLKNGALYLEIASKIERDFTKESSKNKGKNGTLPAVISKKGARNIRKNYGDILKAHGGGIEKLYSLWKKSFIDTNNKIVEEEFYIIKKKKIPRVIDGSLSIVNLKNKIRENGWEKRKNDKTNLDDEDGSVETEL